MPGCTQGAAYTAKPPAVRTSGSAFPHTRRLRVQLRRASLGIRTGCLVRLRHALKRTDAPGPTKKSYNFARSLSMADGGAAAETRKHCFQAAVIYGRQGKE